MWWPGILLLFTSVLADVSDLTGDADFHEATLWWRGLQNHFNITYCEKLSWGVSHCKLKYVENPMMNEVDDGNKNFKKTIYTTKITALRMATNYTFQVVPDTKENRRARKIESKAKGGAEIILLTRKFSVKPKKCSGESSEVEVTTGPNFSGKISVEDVDRSLAEECSVYGNGESKEKKYTLKINYTICGSTKMGGKIESFILVQENLKILTHSTSRFLIICDYSLPETYTVKAGVSMPGSRQQLVPVSSSVDELDDKAPNLNIITLDTIEGQKYSAVTAGPQEAQPAQLVLMIILVVAAVIGCAGAIWWSFKSHRRQHTRGFMSPQTEPRTLVYDNIENFVREQCANSNNIPVDPSVELIGVRQIQPTPTPE